MFSEVKHNGLLLAVIGDTQDIPQGSTFYGDGKSPLEWATFNLDKCTLLQPHVHKVRKRMDSHKTIEFLYIVQGKLRADFYDLDKNKICSEVLSAGEFVCLYDGGHGFKALRSDTKFIEVKSGPFVGIEEDKEKF